MSSETLVPVEEYLNTSYDPDVEYVDGVLVERNAGEWLHSLIQKNIVVALSVRYPNVYAVPELRSQTRSTRYRLRMSRCFWRLPRPDFCWMQRFWRSRFCRKTTA